MDFEVLNGYMKASMCTLGALYIDNMRSRKSFAALPENNVRAQYELQ